MAGLLGKLKEALSITERIKPPEGADRQCVNCIHWVPPAALTQAITKTKHALEWAQKGGYGHCRAPRPGGETEDGKEAQRFTLGHARCKLWSWKQAVKRG